MTNPTTIPAYILTAGDISHNGDLRTKALRPYAGAGNSIIVYLDPDTAAKRLRDLNMRRGDSIYRVTEIRLTIPQPTPVEHDPAVYRDYIGTIRGEGK